MIISNHFVGEWNITTSSSQFILYRQLQQGFTFSPVWDYAKRNSDMLRACFSIAQLIAHTAYTHFSQCTRYGCSNIMTSLTELIPINCQSVQSCTTSFQQRMLFKFGRTVFDSVVSFKGNDYVLALFALNPILYNVVQGTYDSFYKVVAIWKCYKYFVN